MRLVFEQLRTGGDRNFGYLLGDRDAGEAALIDPSYAPKALVERARAQGLKVTTVFNTHGHFDHTKGNSAVRKLTGARVAAFEGAGDAEVTLTDGQTIAVGSFQLRVLHVPGHTADHIVLFVEDWKVACTGDHLFVGKVGGTGGERAAREEWDSFRRMFDELPPETTVWPGHDYGARPSSTLELERRTNPFLLCENFEEFLRLKAEWASFKARHGLK